MSMEAIRSNRGAVSIFLILVLVPCIAVSCIFVDLSRVELSKASAEASADLALNTLLTNYDADLSEYYGLIGSCQNIDDFYTVSAEYFLRTIQSQGLDDDEILLLSGVYANATSDDTIYDLLKVESQTGASEMIEPVANANLGNPAMLKDAVVEFMKYRAPIELATTLIERLKSAGSGVDDFMDAKENETLVEEKKEFFQAESNLLEALIHTYLAIQEYEKQVVGPPRIENPEMEADADQIDAYRDIYGKIHEYAVNYLLNTGHLTGAYSRVTYNINNYNTANIKDLPDVYSSTGKAEDGTTIYYLNGNDLQTQIQAAQRAVDELNTAVNQYANATSDLMGKYPSDNSGYNPVQWWVDMDKAVHNGPYGNVHSVIETKGRAVMNAYKNIKAMVEGCVAEPKPENADQNYIELPPETEWKTNCNTMLDQLMDCYNKFLSASPSNANDAYIKAADALATISSRNTNTIKASGHTVTVDGTPMELDSAVIYIAAQLSAKRSKYDTIIAKLEVVINGDGGDVRSLDDLLTLASTYSTEFGQYDNAADGSTTNMGTTERDYIDKELTLQQEVTSETVTEMKTRLVNIRDQFITLRSKIDSMTYGGTMLKNIQSFDVFKNSALTVVTDANIPLGQAALDNYATTTFEQLFKPAEGGEIDLENTDNDNYDPNLRVNTPKLYQYMLIEFQEVTKENLEQAETDETTAKDLQKQYEKEAKDKATTYRGNADAKMTTQFDSEKDLFGLTDAIGTLITLIGDLIEGKPTRIRDDLYATTYAMEMFSYATFDREAMYRNMSEEARKNMIPSDAMEGEQYYKDNNVYGDPNGDLENQLGMWVSTNVQDDFNKSLTNQMITYGNNHVYLAEVEYLLHGQSDPAENLKRTYGNIYALRFTLNTVSAFQHFWSGTENTSKVIGATAQSIRFLFGGVVPAEVFKAVLLPILAAVETCKDNNRLFAGMPVELYKSRPDDWWVSFDSDKGLSGYTAFFKSLVGDDKRGKNQDEGLFYSDYLTLFVYCAFSTSESDVYTRLGNLISANMHKVLSADAGKEVNYSLANTHMYFVLEAKLRVDPLMVTIPYYLDEYDNQMKTATDWCTYDIRVVRGYS